MSRTTGQHSTTLRQSTQIVIENLETRCMLSASPVSLDRHGMLDVNGTRRSDQIHVSYDHKHSSVLDVTVDGKTFAFKASKVKHILVSGGAGNDNLSVDPAVATPATLLGGTGDDTITAGGGDDAVDGGTGNDDCRFEHQSGVPFSALSSAIQNGLTTLAQGATVTNVQVFRDNGQVYYGAVVSIANVATRIVVDGTGVPVSLGGNDDHNGSHPQEDGQRLGLIFAIDTVNNAVTINVASEHGPGRQITFNVDPNCVITADGTATTLAGLTRGGLVKLTVSSTNPPTVSALSEFGRRFQGVITGIDTNANMLTIPGEHGMDRMLNVDPNAVVMLDGVASTFASLTTGMHVILQMNADNSLVTDIDAFSSDNGHPPGGDSTHD